MSWWTKELDEAIHTLTIDLASTGAELKETKDALARSQSNETALSKDWDRLNNLLGAARKELLAEKLARETLEKELAEEKENLSRAFDDFYETDRTLDIVQAKYDALVLFLKQVNVNVEHKNGRKK